jgi:hypothetical protein
MRRKQRAKQAKRKLENGTDVKKCEKKRKGNKKKEVKQTVTWIEKDKK